MKQTIDDLEKDKASLKELLESTTQAAASAQRRAIQLEKDLADAGMEKSDGTCMTLHWGNALAALPLAPCALCRMVASLALTTFLCLWPRSQEGCCAERRAA